MSIENEWMEMLMMMTATMREQGEQAGRRKYEKGNVWWCEVTEQHHRSQRKHTHADSPEKEEDIEITTPPTITKHTHTDKRKKKKQP